VQGALSNLCFAYSLFSFQSLSSPPKGEPLRSLQKEPLLKIAMLIKGVLSTDKMYSLFRMAKGAFF